MSVVGFKVDPLARMLRSLSVMDSSYCHTCTEWHSVHTQVFPTSGYLIFYVLYSIWASEIVFTKNAVTLFTSNLRCLSVKYSTLFIPFELQVLGPVYTYHLRHRLHVSVCHYLSQICFVCMVTVSLIVRMGSEPILSIKWSISIDTMINFDGDGDGHGYGDGTCKQTFILLHLINR